MKRSEIHKCKYELLGNSLRRKIINSKLIEIHLRVLKSSLKILFISCKIVYILFGLKSLIFFSKLALILKLYIIYNIYL